MFYGDVDESAKARRHLIRDEYPTDQRVGARRLARNPPRRAATKDAFRASSDPARRTTRLGSMHAILAVRTTDGAGRPARWRSAIGTSHVHGSHRAEEVKGHPIGGWRPKRASELD